MKSQDAPTIIIEIENGQIVDMIANCGVRALVVNNDIQNIPDKELRVFPITKKRAVKVTVSLRKVDQSIGFVHTAIESLSNTQKPVKKFDHIQTGYFGRAHEKGHKAGHTHVHLFNARTGNCVCGYRPHKTMQFQGCSAGIQINYVDCPRCKKLMSTRDY